MHRAPPPVGDARAGPGGGTTARGWCSILLRKLVVEFIGTFFFILTIGLVVIGRSPDDVAVAPLAIGATLMVMVYAGGHISGGHYNPAVTLAVWVRGRLATAEVIPYWVAQVLGGVAAGLLVVYLDGHPGTVGKDPDTVRSVIVEMLSMFALASVVLNAAPSKAPAGDSFSGLAIGFTVVIGAFAAGPISGGTIAGLVFRFLNPDDLEPLSPAQAPSADISRARVKRAKGR